MTILETISVFEQPGNYINLMLYTLVGTLMCFAIGGMLLKEYYDISGTIFICLSCIGMIAFIIFLILTITEPKIDTGRKQYIIRVDENTSINEIYENYKIIDHTKYTDVYTVEELEND